MRRAFHRALTVSLVVALACTVGSAAFARTCAEAFEPNDELHQATPLGDARCPVGQLDDAQDAFADNGVDVSAADRRWNVGTTSGRLNRSAPILLPPGPLYLGLSKSGGEGRYVVSFVRQDRTLDRDHASYERRSEAQGAFGVFGPIQADAAREIAWTLDAARVQVPALDEAGFSLEEYRWVRDKVLWAAGHSLAGYDPTALATAAADDRSLPSADGASAPTPPISVERVAPHLDRIEEALVFAWFGL